MRSLPDSNEVINSVTYIRVSLVSTQRAFETEYMIKVMHITAPRS
jgi:hypothetical protein